MFSVECEVGCTPQRISDPQLVEMLSEAIFRFKAVAVTYEYLRMISVLFVRSRRIASCYFMFVGLVIAKFQARYTHGWCMDGACLVIISLHMDKKLYSH